jgi:hypothetical protein
MIPEQQLYHAVLMTVQQPMLTTAQKGTYRWILLQKSILKFTITLRYTTAKQRSAMRS